MIGIIYKTTYLPDKKIYIGQHKCSHENDNYLGSGSELHLLIRKIKQKSPKHWRKLFRRETLKICYTQKQLNGYEVYYIRKHNSINPEIGFNILKSFAFKNGGASSDPRVAKKISEKLKGRKLSEETKRKMGIFQSKFRKGIKLSEETKKKISELNTGKIVGLETRKKLSLIRKGVKLSPEQKEKIRNKQSGEKCIWYNTFWINDGYISKRIKISEQIPENWVKGRALFR